MQFPAFHTKTRWQSLGLRMEKLVAPLGFLLLLLGLAGPVAAQVQPTLPNGQTGLPADTARPRAITPRAERRAQAAADSAKRTEQLFGLRLTRPGKATLLAAVLPGAGQIYNHSYWKLPLVYGALGGVIAGEVFYQTRYREYVQAYELVSTGRAAVMSDELKQFGSRAVQERSAEALQRGIVFYRGYRDIFYLYIGLAYSLQIVDALVDAHLKSFDVSDDLSLHWEPTLLAVPGQPLALPRAPGVAFSLHLK